MSVSIQTNSKVLFLPAGTIDENGHPLPEENLFWFVKSGCNNVFPFSAAWALQASGWSYSVVGRVCAIAGDCEGGMLQFGTNTTNYRHLSPEAYLADYRTKAQNKELLTIDSLSRVNHRRLNIWNLSSIIENDVEYHCSLINLKNYESKMIKEALTYLQANYTRQETDIFQERRVSFTREATTVQDFLKWIGLRNAMKRIGCY